MQPTTSSLTRLFYKDGGQTTTDDGETIIRSKRTKLNKNHRLNNNTASQSSSAETETTTIKKKKKKKRSYNLHKKKATASGVSITSEELCSHVQSVFSDLKEYENSSSNCDTEEGLDRHQKEVVGRRSGTMKEEQQQQHDKGVMKQNSIMLDRHPALVLNADYQPLRMLPLSIWSWQDTVKAVLSGKAVVVDIYPDLYVRAVSLDIPVPSVIALREYAPTGKAVSSCFELSCI